MHTATTTCAYSNPVQFDGTSPGSSLDFFDFASSTCITISDNVVSSTTVVLDRGSSSENPLIIQDSGSLIFGVALILFVLTFAVLGSVFPSRKL